MLRSVVLLGNKKSPAEYIALEKKFGANNYSPLDAVFSTASKCVVTDPKGQKYLDCLAGYGAVNQGHCDPDIINAAKKQLDRVTLSSRAFYNDRFGGYARYITKLFKYDKVLPMNTGAEGVETAFKLARRWGYEKKGIQKNRALIVCARGNFHGRTMTCISMSDDPSSYETYGPHVPGIIKIPYGNAKALETVFKKHHKRIAGYICEPIQGEAGVVIPPKGYLKEVRRLCTKYNVLYIDDEVQSGIGRTGKMLAVDHEGVRPDVVILAKALGGGVLPVSAVLADDKHMVFKPGTHGSTFGGSPLASAVAVASLRSITRNKLVQRAATRGKQLNSGLLKLQRRYPFIKEVRCRGLFSAVEMKHKYLDGESAYVLMKLLKKERVLAKVTHGHTIRITPPLVISAEEIRFLLRALKRCLAKLSDMTPEEAHKIAGH